MKTKELEKQLGITKDTLRFYEKEGLIKPSRDSNGYRHYSQEDIRILQIIIFFRSLELTIDEIKQLFDGTVSISNILIQKKDFLESVVENKKKTIDMIEHTLERKKAYFGFLEIPDAYKNEIYVCFKENEIEIFDYYRNKKYLIFAYDKIEKIRISICTRVSSQCLKDGKITPVERNKIGLTTYFYVDLDVLIQGTVYQYESTSLDHMRDIMNQLSQLPLVEDPLGLMGIFQQNTTDLQLEKVLLSHLKKWQKKFHIDNPRSFEIGSHTKGLATDIRKNDIRLSDVFDGAKMLRFKVIIILFIIGVIVLFLSWLLG